MTIGYYLDLPPDLRGEAEDTIELLLDGMGVWGRPVSLPEKAALVYTAQCPENLSNSAVWIRRSTHGATMTAGALGLAHAALAKSARLETGPVRLEHDLLALVRFVVLGHAERRLPTNMFGIPQMAGDQTEASMLRRPIVSEIIDALAVVLSARNQGFEDGIPRWPAGKRAALLLTHDVDQPHRRAPASFYRRRIARELATARPAAAARALAGWAKARARWGSSLPTSEDPNFGFRYWMNQERSMGGRGCFYVAVRSCADATGHPLDVPYVADSPDMIRALRDATEAGWEVGLHASIQCATEPGRFAEEKALLEALLGGAPVRGVRHHYWALDPENPGATWKAQREAGFEYDSSLGTNDAPAFRRGMAWPFTPPEGGGLLQIPPTMMDGGVFYSSPSPQEGLRSVRHHLQTVFAAGGAAVLDWHLEQSNGARLSGAGPVLETALDSVRGRDDIWITTPADVLDWWKERARRRDQLARASERISLRRPMDRQASQSARPRSQRPARLVSPAENKSQS
ncbi:MAG: hypothetical protein ACI80V_001732 [Rhodothermales bacterium]|jgi:hypothetical protein